MRCACRKKSETQHYADCCEPYHTGRRTAPTAEALMRSRYSAFVMKNAAYLLATWHASTRPASVDFATGQEWLALTVAATTTTGDTATVAFTARSRIGGKAHVLIEDSRFVRDGGRWFYVSGRVR